MLSIRMWGLLRLILLFSDSGGACPPDVNYLTLDPSVIIKEYAEPITVNCTTNNDNKGMYWRVGNVDLDEHYKSFTFLSLPKLDWNTEAQCRIMLNETVECSKHLEITVYRKPDAVIVFALTNEPPVEGRMYELQCNIVNVAPIQNLIVTWYRNNQTMWTDHFNGTTKTPESESSIWTFNISREDNGAKFTCEALLDLGPEGPQPPVMLNDSVTFSVHYPPEFKDKVDPIIPVNKNSNVSLDCEAEGNPPPQYNWMRDGVELLDDTKYLNFNQVNESTVYICTATNYLQSIVKRFFIFTETVTTAAPYMMTNKPASVPKDCPLTITPAEIVVGYGDPVSVNCSTTSTDVIGIGWEGKGTDNVTVATWMVAKLEDWNMNPVCVATMKDNSQCEKIPKITLYKTPDIVSVSALDISAPVFPGVEFQLKCDIINVAPVNNLTVKWYKNDENVFTEELLYGPSVIPKNVSSILNTTSEKGENETKFTCVAELNLGTNGPQPVLSEMSEPYTVVVDCPVTITPAEIVVRYGDPASANCSTSVSDASGMGWEATFGGVPLTKASTVHWAVKKLEHWHIQPLCFISLKNEDQCIKSLYVTVYKTPDKVSVLGDGPMMEGEEYHLRCDISNVVPVDKLKVKWYRNNEYVQDMFNDAIVDPNNNSNNTILRIIPKRDDNGANFTCVAELHLGENGPQPVPAETSEPYTAVVHYKPLFSSCPPDYTGKEHGFSMNMVPCEADANPTPVVQWYYHETLINASELLTRNHSGMYRVEATNQLGKSSTSVAVTIEYGPSFTCNGRYEVEENGIFHSKCEPEGIPKPDTVWVKDGEEMTSPQLCKRQHRGEYIIVATNKHGIAKHTLYLDVLYAPEFKEGNYSKDMISGENMTLDCYAEGNPSPQVQWFYPFAENVHTTTRGQQRSISIIGATSTNAGVYSCGATNKVGNVTRTVTLVEKGKTQAIPLTYIFLSILLIILVVIILMAVFCSRKKKHGQYNFVSTSDALPLSTRSNGV